MNSGKTILIIDDDERYSALLSEELQDEGYKTAHAGNGAEAIRTLETLKPDLIILDIMMPVMNGMEALGPIVRQHEDVPVILHSSYPDFKTDLTSWQADAYLIKASDFSALKGEVKRLIMKGKQGPAEVSGP